MDYGKKSKLGFTVYPSPQVGTGYPSGLLKYGKEYHSKLTLQQLS